MTPPADWSRPFPGIWQDRLPSGATRVRWRVDGVMKSKSFPVGREGDAIRFCQELHFAKVRNETPVVVTATTVDAVFEGWLESRRATGLAVGTLRSYLEFATRVLDGLRALLHLPADAAVPGSALTRDNVIRLANHLRTYRRPSRKAGHGEGLAESTLRTTIRALLDAWTFASDDPAKYPGITPAPRDRRSILPRGTIYVAPDAPSLAEVDAMLRHLAETRTSWSLDAAVVMRSTGLRVSQVSAILVGDVDLGRGTLFVRAGKSAREKAEQRTIPLPSHLVEYLRPLVEGRPGDAHLLRRRTPGSRRTPAATLRAAWEAATVAGEVRRSVWDPSSGDRPRRRVGRPDHAFRAAFQAHLEEHGVRKSIVDALVGHAGGLRDSHYVSDSARWSAMVEAVATIPDITWTAPEERPDLENVVPLKSPGR